MPCKRRRVRFGRGDGSFLSARIAPFACIGYRAWHRPWLGHYPDWAVYAPQRSHCCCRRRCWHRYLRGLSGEGANRALIAPGACCQTYNTNPLMLPAQIQGTTIVFRLLRGRSPLQADRGHRRHRLFDLGMGQSQIALLFYFVCGGFGALALLPSGRGLVKLGAPAPLAILLGGILIPHQPPPVRPRAAGAGSQGLRPPAIHAARRPGPLTRAEPGRLRVGRAGRLRVGDGVVEHLAQLAACGVGVGPELEAARAAGIPGDDAVLVDRLDGPEERVGRGHVAEGGRGGRDDAASPSPARSTC